MSVRVYVEGGGDGKHTDTSTACRSGFRQLFEKLGLPARRVSVVACGSRRQTYKDFRNAVRGQAEDFIILLVDSEGPVEKPDAWSHLYAQDRWQPVPGAFPDQAQLMVQSMEAWLLADRDVLVEFYGSEFLVDSLPRRVNVEVILKKELVPILRHASRPTQKGRYDKVRHGFALLALIDPQKVTRASVYARRLFDLLVRETNG